MWFIPKKQQGQEKRAFFLLSTVRCFSQNEFVSMNYSGRGSRWGTGCFSPFQTQPIFRDRCIYYQKYSHFTVQTKATSLGVSNTGRAQNHQMLYDVKSEGLFIFAFQVFFFLLDLQPWVKYRLSGSTVHISELAPRTLPRIILHLERPKTLGPIPHIALGDTTVIYPSSPPLILLQNFRPHPWKEQ